MVASFKASERWKSNFNLGRRHVGRVQAWLAQGLVSKNTEITSMNRSSAPQASSGSDLISAPVAECTPLEEPWQAPTWDEVVVQLGQEIKALREAQSMTLQHIHTQTKVPLHHLRALESGQVKALPEPIFVRGFLTQICRALGKNGPVLLAKLPDLEPISLQLAVERQASRQPGLRLDTGHLYLAYAMLLTGAVGGLAWIGEQETNPTAAPPVSRDVSQRDVSPQDVSLRYFSAGAERTPPELSESPYS